MGCISIELTELGMDSWFKNHARQYCSAEQRIARVTVVERGQYTVRSEHGDVSAKATRKFMKATTSPIDMACVGDWVCMDNQDSEEYTSIHAVLPRKSFLRRKSAGKSTRLQMIAANIDVIFIVQSCHYDFNVSRLERYLVMANEGHVEPVIILTKTDLVSTDALQQLITEIRDEGITARIIALSNVTGAGLNQVKESMECRKTYCLVGSSGVGKSTLINQLRGDDTLRTQTVSTSGEGRHTTVRRQLFVLEQGALLIDTPGMREVGILADNDGMDDSFDDIHDLALQCRFTNCGHENERGCAVLQAIKEGALPLVRYQNYVKLKTESEINENWNSHKGKKNRPSLHVIGHARKRASKS
ncbi:MAG: ribosome small subunit-dependent GTPase A [Desulforhopalus sp.]